MPRSFVAVLLAAVLAVPALAQRPAEVAGRVVEAGSAAPVEMASVEIAELGLRARTDGTGRFRFRGVEPGRWSVRVSRAGFAPAAAGVEVRAAAEAWVEVALHPAAFALAPVRVEGEAEGVTLTRADVERTGARSLADLVERVPGVVVRSTSPAGPRTASIRGSAPDEVLVLVDGIPLNDPVSGEADLSSLPAASVEAVTVLAGARSARYGPRAVAGVVLVRTRGGRPRPSAALSAGTLGERAAEGEGGVGLGGATLQAGGRMRSVDGAFAHPRDRNDPTPVVRRNADLDEWSVFGAGRAPLGGGDLRLRTGWEALERGLPGTGHTPSPEARQAMQRGRGTLAWRRASAGGSVSALLGATGQRVRYADPAPPFGLAYDDTTRVRLATLRLEIDRLAAHPVLRSWGAGLEGAVQRVRSGALAGSARERRDLGAFVHAAGAARLAGRELTLSAAGRVDRDAGGTLFASRALTAGTVLGGVRLQLSNRSSFAPPTLGDQFFRAGVGVLADPALGPQRVPSEWEGVAGWSGAAGGVELSAHASAYTGEVRGMIVWLPDFRFRWSPRNVDALRRGAEARFDARLPGAGVRLHGGWSHARVTYADPLARGVQLPYRPRNTGSAAVEVQRGGWRLDAAARYTGVRYPAAARLNPLPGFWSTSLRAGRDWRLGGWTLATTVDVDRLRDERDSLIADFPEPGRRVRLDVRMTRTQSSSSEP